VIERARGALGLAAERARGALARLAAQRGQALARVRLAAPPLDAQAARLQGLAARLEAASYAAVLARGFVLVRDASGHSVTRAADVKAGQGLTLAFADGGVRVTAAGRPGGGKRHASTPQESLL
jgi:exodeoxyribonuclease VII large subunit